MKHQKQKRFGCCHFVDACMLWYRDDYVVMCTLRLSVDSYNKRKQTMDDIFPDHEAYIRRKRNLRISQNINQTTTTRKTKKRKGETKIKTIISSSSTFLLSFIRKYFRDFVYCVASHSPLFSHHINFINI